METEAEVVEGTEEDIKKGMKVFVCDECARRFDSKNALGGHLAWHYRMRRHEQEKRYKSPDKDITPAPDKEEDDFMVEGTRTVPVEFELFSVISINGIDFPNTLVIDRGRELRVRPPYRLGQKVDSDQGRMIINRELMNELMYRDSVAAEAERRIFDSKTVKLHYETDGVRRMSRKL